MLKRLVWAVAVGMCMAGCATQTPHEHSGQKYGFAKGAFHGRWWSYYERGASFVGAESYTQAEADLRKAIEGRSKDTWNARTYGLHFVEFFPNRELGVTYFHLGRLDEAERYLTASLAQIDTERAHYYLDQVKQAKLAKGELTDSAAPALGTSLQDGMTLSTREIPLDVRASDDLGVASVRINGQVIHQRGSVPAISFRDTLQFEEGPHTIQIDARDLAGKESQQSLTVNVDITGPAIGIFEPPAELVTDADSVTLRGAVADVNGVAAVRLGEAVLAESKGAPELAFQSTLALKDGANTFVVKATDLAGNDTFSAVSVFQGTAQKTGAFLQGLPDRLLAPLRFAHVRFRSPAPMLAGLADRVRPAVATAAPEPLVIELKFPKQDIDSHKQEVRVTGRVISESKVAGIEFNGKEYTVLAAPQVEFSKRIVLAQGDNPIAVAAKDDQGRTARKEVKVIGKPVTLDSPDTKMSLSVMGFGGEAEASIRQSLRAQTESRLSERGRFDLVDRERLAAVLQEQQLSAALADPDRALQLGKIIPANVFLVAEVIERGAALEVYTRAVSTETSRIVGTFDVHVDDKSDAEKVRFGVDALTDALVRYFPRLSGDVVKVDGNTLILNLGKDEGVLQGMNVIIVHEGDPVKDDSTGEILMEGEYTPIGKATITSVTDKASKAETVKREGDAKLEAGMPAVTM